jgi:hypothetical protein
MWSKDEHVDRAAQKGDVVVGEYQEVVIEGEKQELPENRVFRNLLGESASPGFDEGLIGASAGDIKDIDFITYGCTNNVPNGIHYYLTDIKFNGIEIKDNYVILSYNVGKYDDGKLLSEKFYSKEQQERYDKKEMKENGAALIDIASAAKTLAERDEQEKDDKPRHIRRRRNEELLS